MARILSRVGVTYQIGIIGLLGLAGLFAVGVIYYIGSVELANASNSLARSNAGLEKLSAVKIDLLEARRSEKDFLLRRKEEYVPKHAAALQNFERDSKGLNEIVGVESQELLAKVSADTSLYGAQFAKVAELYRAVGLDESSGLQGTLRKAVHDIEALISGDTLATLDAAMLLMRRHEKDFLARGDAKYVDAMKGAAASFEKKLDDSDLPPSQKAAIKDKLGVYQRDFLAAAAGSFAASDGVAKLSKLYSDLEAHLGQLDQLGHVRGAEEMAATEATSARTSQLIFWSIPILTVFVALFAWLIGRSIARPLTGVALLMRRLANRDFAIEITNTERRDEVGTLARSLKIFKDNMLETDKLRSEQEEAKRRAEIEKNILLNKLADDFQTGVRGSLDTLASAATEMRATSKGMSATAEETSAQATTVAAAAEQASVNVQTVASASEELSSSVAEIGRQVTQSTKIAAQAVEEAQRTNATVHGLSVAADKIGHVVKLISDIASQTNLLALNATIEAARAGDAGKGFAVVASEVKSLANQTAKATEEIASQVAAMQDATGEAVHAIESIGHTISSINEIAATIASAVEEQGAATQEIARNVQEAAQGTNQVSDTIAGVNQAAGETGASASHVLTAAEELGAQAEKLRGDVDKFLDKIRAA
ncbi:MAG: putative methyl-accepting chemotaxis protein [Rhodospirillales bacterium]|nr:putative methyl-accepting chemotaxis protein [Rhodospirillales bacterium]